MNKILLSHPVKNCIVAISSIVFPFIGYLAYTGSSLQFFSLLIIGIFYLAMIFKPIFCSAMIIIITSIVMFVPNLDSGIIILSSLISISIYRYYEKNNFCRLFVLFEIVCNTLSWIYLYNNQIHLIITAIIIYDLCMLVSYFVGTSLRYKDESNELSKIKYQLKINHLQQKEQYQKKLISRKLHDQMTSDLTYLILKIADEKTMQGVLKDDILSHLSNVLNNLHSIITLINSDINIKEECEENSSIIISSLLDLKDRELSSVGFEGHAEVKGIIPDKFVFTNEVVSIINELYANILRHGDKTYRKYIFRLIYDCEELRIVQINTADRSSIGGVSGTGLYSIKEIVKTIGGKLNIISDKDNWIIQIRIPSSRSVV